MTGNAAMASSNKPDNNLLAIDMDVVSSNALSWGCLGNMRRNHSLHTIFVKYLLKCRRVKTRQGKLG